MQSQPAGHPWEAAHLDEATRCRVRDLNERLTEHLRASTFLLGAASEEILHARWNDRVCGSSLSGGSSFVRWNDSAEQYLGSPGGVGSAIVQRLHILMKMRRYQDVHDELARAEISGKLSEFFVLNYRAILAVAVGEEYGAEYFAMAHAVASSPYERAVVAENLATYEMLQGNPFAAAERCLDTLENVCQTAGLWIRLLTAIHHLGQVDMVDVMLRSFTQLDDECMARLGRLLSSEQGLHDMRTRSAYKQLLDKASC